MQVYLGGSRQWLKYCDLATYVEDPKEFLVGGLVWLSYSNYGHWGSEPVDVSCSAFHVYTHRDKIKYVCVCVYIY